MPPQVWGIVDVIAVISRYQGNDSVHNGEFWHLVFSAKINPCVEEFSVLLVKITKRGSVNEFVFNTSAILIPCCMCVYNVIVLYTSLSCIHIEVIEGYIISMACVHIHIILYNYSYYNKSCMHIPIITYIVFGNE